MGGGIGDMFSGVGDAVSGVVGGIGDAVGGIGNVVNDAGAWVDDLVGQIPGGWLTAASMAMPIPGMEGAGGLSSLFGPAEGLGAGITGDVFGASSAGMGSLGGLGSGISAPANMLGTFSEMAAPAGELVGGFQMPSFASMGDIGGLGKGITGSLGSFMPGESSGILSGSMGSLGSIFNGAANWAAKNPMQALKTGSSLYSLFNQPKAPDYSKLYAGMNQQQVRRPEHRRYYA